MRLGILGSVAAIAALLALSAASALAAEPDLEVMEARQDFAGSYRDRDAKVDAYLLVGEANGAAEELLAHYDESEFRFESVTYTLAELQAAHASTDDRWTELAQAGLDLRESGTGRYCYEGPWR